MTALAYLSTFSKNKEQWKFQKAKQIWVLKNMFNLDQIDDEHFDYCKDYLKDMKGQARDNLLVKCSTIRKQYKKQTEETIDKAIYKRAKALRKLLKSQSE